MHNKPRCRHCRIRTRQDNGYRGLCRACHQVLRIRNLYPAIHPARGQRFNVGCPTKGKLRGLLDPNPTEALPGTEAKVQVLIARATAGYALFHPLDGPVRDDNPPSKIPLPEPARHVAEAV
jgi:hypothetical protein